ncbi:MAG TPA: 4Fe-4S binding protein [Candidatus Limiplasma sp.]|nr:4Fe-4S binding protein [Candidatus Limiplasma sp.]
MSKTISAIYFSPTGGTKKSVTAMASALGDSVADYDVTVDASPAPHTFAADDFVVFGMPVYGSRIPKVAAARIAGFQGSQTPCIVAAVYGNVRVGDALIELADLAKAQGFVVKGGAALVARHTFGEIQVGRPNADDLAADKAFALKAAENPAGKTLALPGDRPYKDGGNGGGFRPQTTDACTHCGLCVKQCPTQAIAADCKTISDNCISCFRCIRNCPVGAKNMDTESYLSWAANFSEKFSQPQENAYFL